MGTNDEEAFAKAATLRDDVLATGGRRRAETRGERKVMFEMGAFEVLSELGRGGMGVVYRAWSKGLEREVALKMMTAGRFASDADVVRFKNEAMLAARLQHPNIVPVFDSGEFEGHLFFVMAFVEGEGFAAFIEKQKTAAPDAKRALLEGGIRAIAKAARALDYAHQRGIVHRDIKSDNILIDAAGEPHLTDFGIAKSLQREASITRPGAIIGTPAYMAPEQANSLHDRVGPASDIYSLGATLYHLVTGRAPFEGSDALQIIIAVLQKVPEPARAVARRMLGREVSPDLETIIAKAMEKKAGERYASARELAEDLEAYLEDRPVAARPVGAFERAKKALRRNRAAWAMVVVAALTLVVLAVGFGTVLAFNLSATSDSLRRQDEQAGLDQTATLERAIVANMIEGRADIVRGLVDELRKAPNLSRVEVVRTDKTLAYTDRGTREGVARRILDPATRALIAKQQPGFERQLEVLEAVAFKNIDGSKAPEEAPVAKVDEAALREAIDGRKTVTRVVREGEAPVLTVMRPIENGETCQLCHGPVIDDPDAAEKARANNPYAAMDGGDLYATKTSGVRLDRHNRVRAVLVVTRSQEVVEAQIAGNKRETLVVGAATTLGLLAFLFIAMRVFGLRVRPEKFG